MSEFKINDIYNVNCLEMLQGLPDNSIDSLVTDPPYGMSKDDPKQMQEIIRQWANGNDDATKLGKGFMGKEWDAFVPPPLIWKEIYRVLKPGAYGLVFSSTRTQDLMSISLRFAGFQIKDVVEWLYFSGFPKSHNIGKAIDKMDAKEERRKRNLEFTAFMRSTGLTSKQINDATGTNMAGHYLTDKEQPAVATEDLFSKLRPLITTPIPASIERLVKDRTVESENTKKREVVGKNPNVSNGKAGWQDTGYVGGKVTGGDDQITTSHTPEAKKWDGWGTQLKPSHEPAILIQKPISEKTIADNVLKWGTGGLNIDETRIGEEEISVHNAPKGTFAGGEWDRGSETIYRTNTGRFPANSITEDPDQFYSKYFNITPKELSKKAGKKDRNADYLGNEIGLEEKVLEKEGPLRTAEKRETKKKNNHPTVKPVALMEHLIKMITPYDGVVMDPFLGSGSTIVAARRLAHFNEKYYKLNFIGSELSSEYFEICEARIFPEYKNNDQEGEK